MSDEFDRYLDQLSDDVRREASDAIRQQAEMLSNAQKQALRSMEQDPAASGHLEESCTVVPGPNEMEWIVQAGGDLTTKDIREGSGTDFDYAVAFEFGTSRQPARPFFYNTYQERKDDMQRAINEAIEKVLE